MNTNSIALTYEIVVLMSSWGGMISFFQHYQGELCIEIIPKIVKQLMLSNFVGMIVAAICIESGQSVLTSIVCCGLAGNMAEVVLFRLKQRLSHQLPSSSEEDIGRQKK